MRSAVNKTFGGSGKLFAEFDEFALGDAHAEHLTKAGIVLVHEERGSRCGNNGFVFGTPDVFGHEGVICVSKIAQLVAIGLVYN